MSVSCVLAGLPGRIRNVPQLLPRPPLRRGPRLHVSAAAVPNPVPHAEPPVRLHVRLDHAEAEGGCERGERGQRRRPGRLRRRRRRHLRQHQHARQAIHQGSLPDQAGPHRHQAPHLTSPCRGTPILTPRSRDVALCGPWKMARCRLFGANTFSTKTRALSDFSVPFPNFCRKLSWTCPCNFCINTLFLSSGSFNFFS